MASEDWGTAALCPSHPRQKFPPEARKAISAVWPAAAAVLAGGVFAISGGQNGPKMIRSDLLAPQRLATDGHLQIPLDKPPAGTKIAKTAVPQLLSLQ